MIDLTVISGRIEQYQVMTIQTHISQLFSTVKNVLQNKDNAQVSMMAAFSKQTGYSVVVTQFVHQIVNHNKICDGGVYHGFYIALYSFNPCERKS